MFVRLVCTAALAAFVIAVGAAGSAGAPAVDPKVLVFSKTAGFRHSSIDEGVAAVQSLGAANGFTVDATEDATVFNDANLEQYDAVIWLSTTGDVLNDTQQAAFERYIQAGGGYTGIHSASDTEYTWPWYGGLVGAYFLGHPAGTPTATVKVADHVHPSSSPLPDRWTRTDEWYNYQSNPRGNVHVLATLDETTYTGGTMAPDHPIAWCHVYDGGRAWYTGGGHTEASFTEPLFLEHMLGGIKWAMGAVTGDCGGTVWSKFQKVTLDDDTEDPFEVKIAPDGRVFFIERAGKLKIYKQDTQQTVVAGQLVVNTTHEDGLLGLALDPNFSANNWIYLNYARPGNVPCGPADSGATICGEIFLSRFTMNGDSLDLSSEIVVLKVLAQRDQCCHASGSIDFGKDGNLFLSTGDNSNPFESDGFAPIDERAGRSSWDAQRSAANTNDLRGKLLRIHPESDGTYTIPTGNLFAPGTPQTRPEIYAMGLRNPFRFDADPETGWVFQGDYGPDAQNAVPTRGPAGQVEWNLIKQPVNLGWPYCIANNQAYTDYDFSTMTSGSAFNCAAPVNNSPNNTGMTNLPPATAATVWYGYGASAEFPELGSGCGCPMGGPVYHYDPASTSDRKFPEYYDDTPFFYEWGRNYIKEFKLDATASLLKINSFVPNFTFIRPMDAEFGPDGALYVLEWGTGFGGGNPDSGLYRIDYVKGDHAPVAEASGTPDNGPVTLDVSFSSVGSGDIDGDPISYAWDFESNGSVDSTAANPSHSYTTAGNYTAKLTVTDSTGKTAVSNVPIAAGNTRPTVTIDGPVNGGFFGFGDRIAYSVTVQDPEDSPIDCARLIMQPALGHDSHAHPLGQSTGCQGSFLTQSDGGHGADANLFYVAEATYTDGGAPGVGALVNRDLHILQPKRKQAEYFTRQSGITTQTTTDPQGGGQNITSIDHGDWIAFTPMNLLNIDFVTYRWASQALGGRIEVHVDSPTGPLISDTGLITPTGGAQTYKNVTTPITDPGGTHELYFVFFNQSGLTNLFNLNWIQVTGAGVSICGPDDEFDASILDTLCRWNSIVRPDVAAYRLTGGTLEVDTQVGDILGPLPAVAENLFLQSADHAEADYLLDTKLTSTINESTQQGGLLVHLDDDNYVRLAVAADTAAGRINRIELRSEVGGVPQMPQPDATVPQANAAGPIYLRLRKTGTTYQGEFSFNGTTFTPMSATVANAMVGPRFGLEAIGGAQTQAKKVNFDYFLLNGRDQPTAVKLASLRAAATKAGVRIRWRTGTGVGTVGFNVWRSTRPGAAYKRLNRAVIPAKTWAAPASYSYVDRKTVRGKTYLYKLELVSGRGPSSWAGPVRIRR